MSEMGEAIVSTKRGIIMLISARIGTDRHEWEGFEGIMLCAYLSFHRL